MIVTSADDMAAVTGLMPITGIPLPLVSAGGSSLTFTLGCIGLILAVSRYGGSSRVRLVRPTATRGQSVRVLMSGGGRRVTCIPH